MPRRLAAAFFRLVLGHPGWVLAAALALLAGAAWQAQYFELDASAESLMLEDDPGLETYRAVRARYGSDDFVFVTFTPKGELFDEATLDTLGSLAADLRALEGVASVTSLLNVPLVQGPDVTFSSLQEDVPTLGGGDVPMAQARAEFLDSPLYRDLILSDDADTTAMLVRFAPDARYQELLERRGELRAQRDAGELDAAGRAELAEVERAFERRGDIVQARMEENIARIRAILDDYRGPPRIHLGGVPMIAVDMIDFVASDIRTFGVAVALFIIVLLAFTFQRVRWVVVPGAICASVVVAMVGWIGLMGWPVTVVSSNFISLVLIITLSLIVHLIVRYREIHAGEPALDQAGLVRETIASKFKPSFFTSLTTSISFASLLFADIKPVMDFGLMMTCSVVMGFVLTFVLFPSLLAPFRPTPVPRARHDYTARTNVGLAHLVRRRPRATGMVFALLFVAGVAGALQLTVENRFIDYFHEDTEIYQGMKLIDRELGGTTPLDVILEAPQSFMEDYAENRAFAEEMGLATAPNPAEGYWYNAHNLERLVEIQDWLDGLEATGKILSMATVWQMALQINDGEALEPYELGILYNRLPAELRAQLIEPYMTPDGNEVRFDIRVIDSLPGLERDRLLERIRSGIRRELRRRARAGDAVGHARALQQRAAEPVPLAGDHAGGRVRGDHAHVRRALPLVAHGGDRAHTDDGRGQRGARRHGLGRPAARHHDHDHRRDRDRYRRRRHHPLRRPLPGRGRRRRRRRRRRRDQPPRGRQGDGLHQRDHHAGLLDPDPVELHADHLLRPAHRPGHDLRPGEQPRAAARAARQAAAVPIGRRVARLRARNARVGIARVGIARVGIARVGLRPKRAYAETRLRRNAPTPKRAYAETREYAEARLRRNARTAVRGAGTASGRVVVWRGRSVGPASAGRARRRNAPTPKRAYGATGRCAAVRHP
ncbi:MAG: MMPL family transporter [Halofilum sp. (in: g-proteobacteria)]|nr:MMPL family transporter [Halofilum sp. (in: g-proteobacteria)]